MSAVAPSIPPEMRAEASAAIAPAKLEIKQVQLWLKKRLVLDGVNLEIRPGEIFGILGPNGSGKTSLFRCITGLLAPNHGTLWVDNHELLPAQRVLRAQMGVVFQDPSLDPKLTARENLLLGAALFAIPKKEALTRAKELLVFMELADRENDLVGTFSGGMRRRLELARAIIHRPSLLILDEPTVGLDPYAFARTWQRLLALRRAQDLTLFLSTHLAEEAARCDRLAILNRGRIVACDTPQNLMSKVAGDVLVINADHPEALAEELRHTMELPAFVVDEEIHLTRDRGHELVPRLIEALPKGRVRSIAIRRPTLADAFLKLTGRSLEDLPQHD